MATKALINGRCSLSELCSALGVSRATFYRQGWDSVFTTYRTAGGKNRYAMDEVETAQNETDASRAKAAVLRLRKLLGRISSGGDQ